MSWLRHLGIAWLVAGALACARTACDEVEDRCEGCGDALTQLACGIVVFDGNEEQCELMLDDEEFQSVCR